MANTRLTTTKLMDAMDSGMITYQAIAEACLLYMSEDDVTDMAREYDFLVAEDEDDEEE